MYNFVYITLYKSIQKDKSVSDRRLSASMVVSYTIGTQLFCIFQIMRVLFQFDYLIEDIGIKFRIYAIVVVLGIFLWYFVHKYYSENRLNRLLSKNQYAYNNISFFKVMLLIILIFAPLVIGIILLNNY